MTYIAILGHGVVGSGVAELALTNAASIAGRAGGEIAVKRILDLREFPGCPYADKFTKNFDTILNDPDVKIVVEVLGGVHPAYDFVKAAILAGKSAVSSNKEMVAAKGAELLRLAAENNVNFLFEASVGGGIPIIRPLHQCLAANEIDEIAGILNGTTNFILTKMAREGLAFSEALHMAQQLGYAEANPAADVEGHDACRKICILASLAFGSHVYPECVHTEGIAAVSPADMLYAESAGFAIKLIARAKRPENGKVAAMVSPAFIARDSQLGGVDDVFNGILVRGNATGDVVFYGKGAGKLPTASAVWGDIIDCAKAGGNIGSLRWRDSDKSNVADYREQPVTCYVRCRNGKSAVENAFGHVRYLSRNGQPTDELAFIAPQMSECELKSKLNGLDVLGRIRVLDF